MQIMKKNGSKNNINGKHSITFKYKGSYSKSSGYSLIVNPLSLESFKFKIPSNS